MSTSGPTPDVLLAHQTLDWGRTDYASALAQQETLLAQRQSGAIGDTLIFTEHEPVYTLGVRRESEEHLIWTPAELAQHGIALAQSNRGGDITYHGPGQLVGYPIIALAPRKDLHAYLRFIEQVLINTVAHFGLTAGRREGKTGIWLGSRKIAAIGVAVKKWTTYHGFALNVSPDLAHFAGIVPCGITDGTVTSMQAELGTAPDLAEVKCILATEFWRALPGFFSEARKTE